MYSLNLLVLLSFFPRLPPPATINAMAFLPIYICLSLLAIAKGELVLQASSNNVIGSACPCDNPIWCEPIRNPAKKEVGKVDLSSPPSSSSSSSSPLSLFLSSPG